MKTPEACMHCGGPLGDAHRAVKRFVVGRCNRWLRGRCCEGCWNGRLLGSLLHRADVCKREPCSCGWCEEWKALEAARAAGGGACG